MLLTSAVLWGGAWVAAKVVVAEIHPFVAGSIRFWIAFGILLPLLWRQEGRIDVAWRDLPLLAFQGATGVFLYNVMFLKGMQITSPVNGSLIVAAGPVITALLSAALLRERVLVRQWAGFIVSLAGVLAIISHGSPSALWEIRFNAGDLMIVISTLSWSLYSVGGKAAMKRFSPLATTTLSCGLGAVMLTLVSIPHWSGLQPAQVSVSAWGSLAFLALLASALAFVLWFAGIQVVGASRAAIFQNVVPLSAAVLAMFFLAERLFPYHLWGGLLILSGVYLATQGHKPLPVGAGVAGHQDRSAVIESHSG